MTDSTIYKRVIDELGFEPGLNAAHIGVVVDDAIVTLSGHVERFDQKATAEAAVMRIKGVRGIAEELTVRTPAGDLRDDGEIARQALAIMGWEATGTLADVRVTVETGWVTLSGEVDSYFQRMGLEDAVRRLKSVRGITNLVNMRPSIVAEDVAQRLKAVFERYAVLDSARLTVTAFGGKVTLEGKVDTLYARELAKQAAWGIPGVTFVDDFLEVVGTGNDARHSKGLVSHEA